MDTYMCMRMWTGAALIKNSLRIRRRITPALSLYTGADTPNFPSTPLSLSLYFLLPTCKASHQHPSDSSGADWQPVTSHTPARHLSTTQHTASKHTHYSNYRPIFLNSNTKALYCIFKLFVIMTAAFIKKEVRFLMKRDQLLFSVYFTYLFLSLSSLGRSEQ